MNCFDAQSSRVCSLYGMWGAKSVMIRSQTHKDAPDQRKPLVQRVDPKHRINNKRCER